MASQEDIWTFAGRLATFERPRQVNKRRASNNKKKQANTVSWPHENPAPEQLAKAGFYYNPTSSSPDSVTCYLCKKALDGWDTDDNPAVEHLSHVPNCGWAVNCCIEQRSQDMDRAEEDPLSENMVEARRATFQDRWPHENKKGWKCKTTKMVNAGWCYSPLPEADDCVTCFYCGASLDGWEPKDDPWQEHHRRAPECHFFTLVDESAQLRKATKSKKAGTSRASKASRQSTQSNIATQDALKPFPNDDPTTEEGDSLLSAMSTTSKAGRPRKRAAKAAKPKGQAKASRKATRGTIDSINDSQSQVHTDEASNAELEILSMEAETAADDTKPAKATRRGRARANTAQSVAEDIPKQPEPAKPKKTRGTKKTKAKQAIEQQEDQEAAQDHAEEPEKAAPPEPTSRRGRKRMSDGSEKLDESVIVLEQPPEISAQNQIERSATPPLKATASKTRKGRKSSTALETRSLSSEREQKKATRGKKQPQGNTPESQPEPEPEEQGVIIHEDDIVPEAVHVEVETQENTQRDDDDDDDDAAVEHQAAEPQQQPTPPPQTDEAQHASLTPQSSDAENQPPSSRPASSIRPQLQTIPIVGTPTKSPSKRNLITVNTAPVWQPIDTESIFAPSPRYADLGDTDAFNIETIIQNLSSPEKKLTVEEWITKNASEAEDRLKQDCERMIGKFEQEGNRALTAMEGIECS